MIMNLADFVKFYRTLKQRQTKKGVDVIGEISLTKDNVNLLKRLGQARKIGSFREITLAGREVSVDQLSPLGSVVEVIFRIASSGEAHIYMEINEYLEKNKSLCLGDYSAEYYLINEDYYSEEKKNDSRFLKIQKLCDVVRGLGELAHYHDFKSNSDRPSLVFVNDGELNKAKPVVLIAELKFEMLALPELDVSIFSNLIKGVDNPHKLQEQGTFRATIVEFFGKSSNDTSRNFEEIIKHWKEFIQLFNRNFETYISGFAFHKAKQEVVDAEISTAEQLSKIIGELTGKLLGIPLSLAAIIGVAKADNVSEQIFIVLGILLAAFIISETLHNQKRQFKRISNASSLIFEELERKRSTYPADLSDYITNAVLILNKSKKSLLYTLNLFILLSWVPAIVATIYFGFLQKQNLIQSFNFLVKYLCS